MQKHVLEKQVTQLVIQANQYFKETYNIHSFYDIHCFFKDYFAVSCNAIPEADLCVLYTFDINQDLQGLYDNLITTGKNTIAYGKDNLEYLKKLQKSGVSMEFSKYNDYQLMLITIYDIHFHINMLSNDFKENFWQKLLLALAKDLQSNSSSKYKEDENFQAFVQFAMQDISQALYLNQNLIELITPSFSDETMEMYQAIATLYELKNA